MACSDSQSSVNNALHSVSESKATLTVEYGPYMNWGRWNHNPRRVQALINQANTDGYSVQLKHETRETSWENHGWVKVTYDGEVLAESDKAQHNRNWSGMKETMQGLAKTAIAKIVELQSQSASQENTTNESSQAGQADVQTTAEPAQSTETAAPTAQAQSTDAETEIILNEAAPAPAQTQTAETETAQAQTQSTDASTATGNASSQSQDTAAKDSDDAKEEDVSKEQA